MTDKKPKVIAFYRDHPTLKQMADDLQLHISTCNEQLDFLAKRYKDIQKEAQAETAQRFGKIGAEIDRLQLCPGESFEKKHFHVDFDTMTFQRCSGNHGIDIGTLLGIT